MNIVRELVATDRQGLVRCIPGKSNLHARIMAELISAVKTIDGRSIRAVAIGSHLSQDAQISILKDYERGEIDVLTSTRFLDEGWDSRRARFCINAAPTTSPVITTQLLGRILRRTDDSRESIYVDFIDEMEGLGKGQYTALHALDLVKVDVNRVLGVLSPGGAHIKATGNHHIQFSPQILKMFTKSQGRLTHDLSIGKPREKADPLVRLWEEILAKEGQPAELDYNIALDNDFRKRLERARLAYLNTNGRDASDEEAINAIPRLSEHHQRLLGAYGIRVPLEEANDYPTTDTDPEKLVLGEAQTELLESWLDKLSAREADVITMRYGLYDGTPKKMDEIAATYGVTPERIRQIERHTLSVLRRIASNDANSIELK
jgi:RNA polymerase sigma factor (sigma-70 family)